MRGDRTTVLRYRAIFGLGYVLFGALALGQVLSRPAPANAKLIGAAFAALLLTLGIVRISAYLRARGEPR